MRGAKYEIEDTGYAFEVCRNGKAVAVVNYSLGHSGAIAVRTALDNLETGRTVRAKRPVQQPQHKIAAEMEAFVDNNNNLPSGVYRRLWVWARQLRAMR